MKKQEIECAEAGTISPGWAARHLRRVTSSAHQYMPEVDGLRFIAILSVLLFHVFFAAQNVGGVSFAPSSFGALLWPVRYGHRGVELFFVISGFILGLPFAAQFITGGRKIEVRRYFLRRLTRLEPPYFVALLALYAAAFILRTSDARDPDFVSSLFLRLGYAHGLLTGTWPTLNGPTWSLEIEVQFYLLAPLVARSFKLAPVHRRSLFVALICCFPLVAPMIPRSSLSVIGYAQFFLAGFLLADIHVSRAGDGWISQRALDLVGSASLLALFLIPDSRLFGFFYPWLLATMFLAALRGARFRAALRRTEVAIAGGMCYSIYLLHYPILSFVAGRLVHDGLSVSAAFVLLGLTGLPIAVFAGVIFYVLLERPCMHPNWPRTVVARARQLMNRQPNAVNGASPEAAE